jgi:cyclic pyranopterin phosphate synthase
MPESVQFLPRKDILSFEEIARVVRITAAAGVSRIRLTGGEPLVRGQLWKLVEMLKSSQGVEDVALTTNGILLADQAKQLRDHGLDRVNISLDTLDPSKFEKITRRKGLEQVLAGIDAAIDAGFEQIRINAVSMTGITESEIIPLARFAREKNLELRFIEFMPLDGDESWQRNQVLTGESVRQTIVRDVAGLLPIGRSHAAQPASDFEYVDGKGRVGFINSVTEPFCASCDRIRMTAEGKFRNCLFSTREWDLRNLIRTDGSDEQILGMIRDSVANKAAAHGINSDQFQRPEKAMYQIGG